MTDLTSLTGPTTSALTFQAERMLKDKLLLFGRDTMVRTKDGELSILMILKDHKRRDLTKNQDSTVTDHSTWFQDFHFTELLNLMELTTLLSTDMSREETTNNGSSTALTRPSDPTTGRTMPLKSNPTEDQPTSEPLPLSTQDGGNCSEFKDHSL